MFGFSCLIQKRFIIIPSLVLAAGLGLHATDVPHAAEPTDAKARKTFASAVEWQKHHNLGAAMEDFRKANKQDGGHCSECLRQAYELAIKVRAFKDAEEIAREWLPLAQTDTEKGSIHYLVAGALQRQGLSNKKEQYFADSCEEFKAAMQLDPKFAGAHYAMGVSLAHLHRDDEARREFAAFLDQDKQDPSVHERAERFVERVELVRANMAPPFSITTLDGQHVSMDSLAGKVVLIDFWATWCGPCRNALPHISKIAHSFDGLPFKVLSISVDHDEAKWKDFVEKNGMTWLQYRDGNTPGEIAKQFNVTGIPATFTIDADGVLEDQHVGDADIEGKLKKLIARAVEVANRKPVPVAGDKAAIGKD